MAIRARQNFLSGIISGTITTSTTSLTGTVGSANFPTPAAGYYTPIILNPGYFGATNTTGPEVVFVQPGGSTSVAIVTRGQDGTSATVTGANIPWVAGPLVSDFDASNLSSSGTVTFSGNFVVASGITTSGLTVQNNAIISGDLTVSGTTTLNSLSVANEVDAGNLTVGGNLTAGGTSIQFPSGVLQVGLGATVTGNLSVSGNITTSSGGKVVTNFINSPGYTAYSNGSTGGVLVNGVQFPLTIASDSYVSIYPYSIPTSAAEVANIALSLPESGTYLITGQLTINNSASSAANATLWLTTSGSATQINAPIASYISFTASGSSQPNTIPMNGLVTTTGAAYLTLYGQASNSNLSVVGGGTGATLNSIVAVRIS